MRHTAYARLVSAALVGLSALLDVCNQRVAPAYTKLTAAVSLSLDKSQRAHTE